MYKVSRLICFKLILTSFAWHYFLRIPLALFNFFAGVISSFQFASFHLAAFRFIAWDYLVSIHIP